MELYRSSLGDCDLTHEYKFTSLTATLLNIIRSSAECSVFALIRDRIEAVVQMGVLENAIVALYDAYFPLAAITVISSDYTLPALCLHSAGITATHKHSER